MTTLLKRFAPKTFRSKLFATLGIMLVLMVLVQSTLVSIFIERQIVDAERNEKVSLAQTYAEQSVFSLLVAVDDAAVAKRMTDNYVLSPNIVYAALFRTDGELAAESGLLPESISRPLRLFEDGIAEDQAHWTITKPVFATTGEGEEEISELVGSLMLVSSKEQVLGLVNDLEFLSTLVLLALSVVIGIWMTIRIRRITEPLNEASEVLKGGQAVRLKPPPESPEEFQTVAAVFNDLMDQVESEQRHLEEQVASRTSALQDALRAAQDADRERTDFSAAITHEMKTPLHAMTLLMGKAIHDLEFLGEDGAKVRGSLSQVLEHQEDLQERINQILAVSRRADEMGSIQKDPIEVEGLVAELNKKLSPLARQNKNTLSISAEGASVFAGDFMKLRDVITNLLGNACKFTKNGDVSCQILVRDNIFSATIKDNGIGIAKDKQADIFDAYRQLDSGVARRFGGTGLGLTIAKNYTTAMGGTIEMDSDEGVGTTVVVRVPVSEPDQAATAEESIG